MSQRGPFGADTPDEVLIAYVNGRLTGAERAEVERWLGEHPAWRARLASYGAIGNAVRHGVPSSGAPDIGSLGGLWAAIDAEGAGPGASALPPPPAPPPPPPPGDVVSLDARRRQPRWLLAAAAAGVLAVGGAVVVAQRGVDERNDRAIEDVRPQPQEAPERGEADAAPPPDEAVPDPPGEAVPGVPEDVAGAQAWREIATAVESTRAAGTARLVEQSLATLDLEGTRWEDADGVRTDVSGAGRGVIDFAEGTALDVELTNVDGRLWPDAPVRGEVVQLLTGETYVACEGEELRAVAVDESGCAFGAGVAPVDLFELLDALAAGDGDVLRRGLDPEGLMGYQLAMELPIGGQPQAAEVHVYVDREDGWIDVLRVYVPDGATAEVPVGGAAGDPALVVAELMWFNVELSDHGEPVTLPDLD